MHAVDAAVKPALLSTVHHGLGNRGVVAVSGGADSVALLRAFAPLRPTVAHVNHQLRGAASDADEAFVRNLAASQNMPFVSTRVSTANTEAAARTARYDWFATLECDWVATAHTADDQTETILHRLVRGTGLVGLQGIPRLRGRYLRPFLGLRRADILDYLRTLGQDYREDASNADRRFTRNRLRHDVLPVLRELNPDLDATLASLTRQAGEAQEFLTWHARQRLAEVELPRAGDARVFDTIELHERTPAVLRREIYRLVWGREGWPQARMTFAHWHRLALGEPGDYPGGVRVEHGEGVIVVSRG